MKGTSIAGRKQNTEADLYETPKWPTEALLRQVKFSGTILEPACGYGAITEVLKASGYKTISSDKFDYGCGAIRDFLTDYPPEVPNIVTNPPYKLAKEFVLVAKMVATQKIAMLLKLSFLEGVNRYRLFADTQFPLAAIYVFCRRVNLYPYGMDKPKNSGTIAYAWFVWDKKHSGPPVIKWII